MVKITKNDYLSGEEEPPVKREEVALYEKVLLSTLNSSERNLCSAIEASAKRVELVLSENNKKIEGLIQKQNSLLAIATRKSAEDNFVEVLPFSDSSTMAKEKEEFYEVKRPKLPKKKMKLHLLIKKGLITIGVFFVVYAVYLGFVFLASKTVERFELNNIAPAPKTMVASPTIAEVKTEVKPVDAGKIADIEIQSSQETSKRQK